MPKGPTDVPSDDETDMKSVDVTVEVDHELLALAMSNRKEEELKEALERLSKRFGLKTSRGLRRRADRLRGLSDDEKKRINKYKKVG